MKKGKRKKEEITAVFNRMGIFAYDYRWIGNQLVMF